MTPVYLVAFSGHRTEPQPGRSAEELKNCHNLIRQKLSDLQKRAEKVGGTIHLASSAAEGADLIACDVAIEEEIPLHLILPLNQNSFKDDFNEPNRIHSWQDALNVIDHARSGKNNSTIRVAISSHLSPDCYHETNLQLLESADALITVWNGQESESPSGTHSVWLAAEQSNLPRIHINPVNGETDSANLEEFAKPDGPGLKIIRELLPETSPEPCELIKTLAADLDESANKHSKNTRDQTRLVITLHGVASGLTHLEEGG